MLHKNPFIIATATFRLIQQLQAIPELKNFHLVGGTALALQLGQRNSIDIDLFTKDEFEAADIIRHNYELLKPPITEEGISFLSTEDIAAMKFHVIIQSGKRLKDFIDIYFLLQHFSMKQMIEFFSSKYSYSNPMIAMKAINFFDDIDENIDPPKLMKPLPLKKITARIREATLKPDKIFKQE